MTTASAATQLVSRILDLGLHQSGLSTTVTIQGCRFSLSHGQIGHNHPTLGWYLVYDFNSSANQGGDAVENIQWVLDEYGA